MKQFPEPAVFHASAYGNDHPEYSWKGVDGRAQADMRYWTGPNEITLKLSAGWAFHQADAARWRQMVRQCKRIGRYQATTRLYVIDLTACDIEAVMDVIQNIGARCNQFVVDALRAAWEARFPAEVAA